MSESHPLLDVDSVSRFYENGSVRALDQVSLRANAGETIALTGASGCGKSTLLSLIGLLDQPTAGRLRIGGQDLAAVARPAAFRARTLGFVFQFHHMVPTMTLLENVAAPMIALGVARAERLDRAHAMLAAMDLGHRADFLPSRVSGGERQRAAVARALINRPPVLLADEPTGNLDSQRSHEIMAFLAGLNRQGITVLMVTHEPDMAAYARRIVRFVDGRVASDQRHARPTQAAGQEEAA